MIRHMITLAWSLLSLVIFAVGVFMITSDTTTIRVNGESINYIYFGVCLLVGLWFSSIAFSFQRGSTKYTTVSSLIISALWAVLLYSQITLLMSGELVTYKYLFMYCIGLLLAIFTVSATLYSTRFQHSA